MCVNLCFQQITILFKYTREVNQADIMSNADSMSSKSSRPAQNNGLESGGKKQPETDVMMSAAAVLEHVGPDVLHTRETVPCNKCETRDDRSKVRCVKCRKWWHHRQCVGPNTLPKK